MDWSAPQPMEMEPVTVYLGRVIADMESYVNRRATVEHRVREPSTESVGATLAERGARYGDFTDHAEIAQALQDGMRAHSGWRKLDATKKQALTVIADKIARILNGDPEYRDNWHDIQGYAKLAEDRCK